MISFPDHVYVVSSIDQSLTIDGDESRTTIYQTIRGAAVARSRLGATEIRATDRAADVVGADIVADLDGRAGTAAATAKSILDRLQCVSCNARIVALARYVNAGDIEDVATSISIAMNVGGVSFVTSPQFLLEDTKSIGEFGSRSIATHADPAAMPIVWRAGTGGVLLHEAVGHAAEENADPLVWPAWLTVLDDPREFPIDDCGAPTKISDLLREAPQSFRRASFPDVPAKRMTNVVVSTSVSPVGAPRARIEVLAVAGGHYDRVSDSVRIDVSVARVVLPSGEQLSAAPFRFIARRASIARTLAAVSSTVTRYPGVICSAEGIRVAVGTASIDLLTEPA